MAYEVGATRYIREIIKDRTTHRAGFGHNQLKENFHFIISSLFIHLLFYVFILSWYYLFD